MLQTSEVLETSEVSGVGEMDQRLLPQIKPYVNRGLFSDHFLDELLPDADSWQVDEDEVRLAWQAALNLYGPRKDELPQRNEAQLEREFVRPLLEALGHHFEVQPSLPTSDGVRRPDYAFFATEEDKGEALRKHKGELDYFKRAIAVGDAKQWGRPLDKRRRVGADKFDMLSPSWQIDYYLRMSEVPWGILTDGRFWRLYSRDTSFRLDVHYQIDLPHLVAQRDMEAFKYFFLFFRRQAFVRDAEGLCFLDRVYQGSLEYAREVGDDLKENVYRALRLLAEGFLETRGNDLDPVGDLEAIHENSLVYLYRLLFINYAEDRRLLPRHTPLYRETYGLVSMEGEIASKLERREALSPLQATYWERLDALFDLINRGSEAFGIEQDTLLVPPYNGGLFDPQRHPFLERNKVADRWLAPVIDLLARSKGEGAGRAFVDYSSLDVRHLGSIYEGLLEYKLRVAEEERVAVKRRRREEWVPATEAEGKRIVERVKAGGLYLATDRGERKATGSYYTPDYIVKYIVEHTVGPLIEEKMKEQDAIDGILSLKVLDPAMGSGHFLVEATDRLAHALVEALGGSEEETEEEDIRWARREVVERCIYGVDLNPLAVELAKLSLWLHTVAEGKPLNFLDHHLKAGNSLIGAWVEDLGSLPVRRKRGKAKEPVREARQMNLFETRLTEKLRLMLKGVLDIIDRRSDTLDDIKAKTAADQAVEQLKAPFKAVGDLWVSTYFGNEVTEGQYQEALERIGEPGQLLALAWVKEAQDITEDKRFFHWELEFPEVFYEDSKRGENPGFDAVVGNPPYVAFYSRESTKPSVEEERYLATTYSDEVGGRINTFLLFLAQSLRLTRQGGCAALIVPDTLIHNESYEDTRRYLLDRGRVQVIHKLAFPVFADPTVRSAIPVVAKGSPGEVELLVSASEAAFRAQTPDVHLVLPAREIVALPKARFPFMPPQTFRLNRKMSTQSIPLGALAEVRDGINPGPRAFREQIVNPPGPRKSTWHRLIEGEDIFRYEVLWSGKIVDYDPSLLDRDLKAQGASFRELWIFSSPKLVSRQTSDRLSFAYDDTGLYALNSVHHTILREGTEYSILYVLSLLNSSLMNQYYRSESQETRKVFPQVHISALKLLPIRRIDFSTPPGRRSQLADRGRKLLRPSPREGRVEVLKFVQDRKVRGEADVVHDVLVYLAEEMIEMNKKKKAEAKGFLDWLVGYTRLPIEDWRLKTRVKAYWQHGWDEVRRALRQNRKAIEEASGRNVESRETLEAIQKEFDQSVTRLEPLLERIASTDRLIDLIVYRLYGLTEEEVAIVEESVN